MLSKLLPQNITPPGWLKQFYWAQDDAPNRWLKNVGLAILGASVAWCIWKRYDNRNLPPGPRGWPIIGVRNLPLVGKPLLEYGQKYGDVFSAWNKGTLQVYLNSHAAIKDALVLQGDTFAGRPSGPNTISKKAGFIDDIFSTPYHTPGWNANKNMLASCLRSSILGESGRLQNNMFEQMDLLISHLDGYSSKGKPVNIFEMFPKATVNVMCKVLMNKSFDYDDPKLVEIAGIVREWIMSFGFTFTVDDLPLWWINLMHGKQWDDFMAKTERVHGLIRDAFEEHQKTLNPDEPRDFIDLYLIKSDGQHSLKRMVHNTVSFFPDGIDTMLMILSWMFLYVIYHPDVQKKMADEIESITGGNRYVSLADRPKLPYTEAVLMEIMRIQPTASLTLPHCSIKDVNFRGYRIPAGANVICNLYAALKDPAVFDDPEVFRPERFLDDQGALIKNDNWIPFSMGRRQCPGQQLMRVEMFLMATNIIQKYHLNFAEGEKPPLEGTDILFSSPPDYNMLLTART